MIRHNTTKFIKEYSGGEPCPDRCVTRNLKGGEYGERKTLTTDTTYFSTTEKYIPESQRIIHRQQREDKKLYGIEPKLNISAENPYQHFTETHRESHHGKNEDAQHWLKGGYEVRSNKVNGTLVTINNPQDIAYCDEWFEPSYAPDVPTTRIKENVLFPSRIRYVPEDDRDDLAMIEQPTRRKVIYPTEPMHYPPNGDVKYPYVRSTTPNATKGWYYD